jgi:hypothetical protein
VEALPRKPRVHVLKDIGTTSGSRRVPIVSELRKKMSGERSRSREDGYQEEDVMNGLIYLVGLIVVIMAILSLFGLR